MENSTLTVVNGDTATSASLTGIITDTTNGSASGSTTIANYPFYSYPYPTTAVYNTNLTVRSVSNGFVVDYGYVTYVAKTQKELSKLIAQLLTPTPKKGKK